MTPSEIRLVLDGINWGFKGSSNRPQAEAEELALCLSFIQKLADKEVQFPQQSAKVLYDNLQFIKKQ